MKGLRFLFAIGLVAAFGVSTAYAQPQRLDHLKCYKVKDPAKFAASVTLEALQTQFGLEDCELKGKAQFFCVPVDKTVTAYKDKSKPPLAGASFISQKLAEDRVCYKLKCPKVSIPDILVSDQFGTRNLSKFSPVMLCTPARKATIDNPDDCLGTAPQCNGACPNADEICRPVLGTTTCTCQGPPHDLCPDTAPQCNGDCPVPPGGICRPSADGTGCSCDSPPTPCSGSEPQCNGDCPAGSKCLVSSNGKCDCFDPTACQSVAGATCNGSCQIPGQVCQPNALTAGCRCQFPTQ
jgi:hypothetical protein